MKLTPSLPSIKRDLNPLHKWWVVVYGSYASGNFTQRSDIDVAIITQESNKEKNKKIWLKVLGQMPQCYDVKIFELLPLEIKAEIMKNHQVIFGDEKEISEYFYHFRKLWDDMKHRYYGNQFTSIKEKLAAFFT
ncbi:MAG TPA: nucleotidyltransferase domain-containing protein [Candidatus Nanoarchaeia archaeon]|nr:nucleotidyltransferase domain-containing protein [Candidatus Nanoarchaeia archaeon]